LATIDVAKIGPIKFVVAEFGGEEVRAAEVGFGEICPQ
jgi:hypothetical protein